MIEVRTDLHTGREVRERRNRSKIIYCIFLIHALRFAKFCTFIFIYQLELFYKKILLLIYYLIIHCYGTYSDKG